MASSSLTYLGIISIFFCQLCFGCEKPLQNSAAIFLNDTMDRYGPGVSISYKCRPGYGRSGKDMSIKCLPDGSWTEVSSCSIKRCSLLSDIIHGSVEYSPSGPIFGTEATFHCNDGFVLVGVDKTRCELQAEGDLGWSNPAPVCVNLLCSPPRDVDGGFYFPKKEEYGHLDAVTYGCFPNTLQLIGNKTLVCFSGEWNSPPPACREIKCPLPTVAHGYITSHPRRNYPPGSFVQIACHVRYVLAGSTDLSICSEDGVWKPPLPTCISATTTSNGGGDLENRPTDTVIPSPEPTSSSEITTERPATTKDQIITSSNTEKITEINNTTVVTTTSIPQSTEEPTKTTRFNPWIISAIFFTLFIIFSIILCIACLC